MVNAKKGRAKVTVNNKKGRAKATMEIQQNLSEIRKNRLKPEQKQAMPWLFSLVQKLYHQMRTL